MKLRELGEDRLIAQLTRTLPQHRPVVNGPGDDCALVRFDDADDLLVLKTDCVVAGVHFTDAAKPSAVGWKAMARPLSDFAAMSAVPQFALVTLIAPASTKARWVRELYRGLEKAAAMFEVSIVGGETSRTDGPLAIAVNISGRVEEDRAVLRSGGKPGDELFVTGRLGGSLGGRHLTFVPRIAESRWLTAQFKLDAMMDLSDGLGVDLPRLAASSDLNFEVEPEAIPRNRGCTVEQAFADGEDYELLFSIASNASSDLQRRWRKKFPHLPLTRVGRLIRKSKSKNGKLAAGYVHFQ